MTHRLRRRRACAAIPAGLLAGALAGSACTAPPPASLEVEVLSGAPASASPQRTTATPERVAIVLDLTLSMKREVRPGGPSRAAVARAEVERLLGSLPARTPVALRMVGVAFGAACTAPVQLARQDTGEWGSVASRRASMSRIVRTIPTRSESSLEEALAGVAESLDAPGPDAGGAPGSVRVVVVSDMGADCAADPCAALGRLVERGAQVDVLAVGEDAPPCPRLPAPDPPAVAAGLAPPGDPAFHVLGVADESAGAILARGRSGGGAVPVPAGSVRVVVELDPPLEIGPVTLAPGQRAALRVVDFPGLDPPERAWELDVAGGDAEADEIDDGGVDPGDGDLPEVDGGGASP